MEELNLDEFSEKMKDIITKKHVALLIDMPAGTQEPEVRGTGVGTLDFYILMAAIRPVFMKLIGEMGGPDNIDAERVIDGLWKIIRDDITEELERVKDDVRSAGDAAAGRDA